MKHLLFYSTLLLITSQSFANGSGSVLLPSINETNRNENENISSRTSDDQPQASFKTIIQIIKEITPISNPSNAPKPE